MMKVLGGSLRGRRLRTARGRAMRPTAAIVRETLFNLIGPQIAGCRFLDLCAGSGGVGIEALSRGAEAVCFVDNHPTSIGLILRNISSFGLDERVLVMRRDAVRALDEFHRRGLFFDEAFLDPPYDSDVVARCLLSPSLRAIIPRRGRIFVEHGRRPTWPDLAGWEVVDRRSFGDTVLTVLRGVDDK